MPRFFLISVFRRFSTKRTIGQQSPSKNRSETAVETAAGAVGRGSDADTSPIAYFIDLIQNIKAIKAQLYCFDPRIMRVPDVFHAEIRRPIVRKFFKIRKTGAQAVAIQEIRIDQGVFKKSIAMPPEPVSLP